MDDRENALNVHIRESEIPDTDEIIHVQAPSERDAARLLAYKSSHVTEDSEAQPQISTYAAIRDYFWGASTPVGIEEKMVRVSEHEGL